MATPQAMPLYHDTGYPEIPLPTTLDHNTAAEATHQSGCWLPLLAWECHPNAHLFLCSLFGLVGEGLPGEGDKYPEPGQLSSLLILGALNSTRC